jgi:hypothetical protein
LQDTPDLVYVLQLYDDLPYGAVQVKVRNRTGKPVSVQAIRNVEAIGEPRIGLAGRESADRVYSDTVYGLWGESMAIRDLGRVGSRPNPAVASVPPLQRGAYSQLIYNRESKQSLFLGALSADRFVTLLRLMYEGSGDDAKVASYTVDSTGMTEAWGDFEALSQTPAHPLVPGPIELSLQLNSGENMASERLMIETGPDYHAQLLAYGDAIRRLHHARVSSPNLLGWWSWTSYYDLINEGAVLTNAHWLSENLKSLGYNYFFIDAGYNYAQGEYSTPNAALFPHGMRYIGDEIRRLGLTLGIWTAPFAVEKRAWVYEHHKDWLVHAADGTPLHCNTDPAYALDTTNPGAQDYLRQTYTTMTREWGVRLIKLDSMDVSAVEGYFYKPNTTALEALRIGVETIRKAVGDDVLIDKDDSSMLPLVGLVDLGRVSTDTSHSFIATRRIAQGVAERFYMHRNFFVNDPDAFTIGETAPGSARAIATDATDYDQLPVSLAEAQAAIMVSAVSGGMYEIGDDLPTVGATPDRMALVKNQDLLQMAKLSRASTPLDLMSYQAEDEQPSIFFLQEEPRQSILTVFNWTEKPRSHTLKLVDLGLPSGHTFRAFDVFNLCEPVALDQAAVRLENQAPHSVRVIKLIDSAVPAEPPAVTTEVPSKATVFSPVSVSAQSQANGVPAISYHWEFGDGCSADGRQASHAYTLAGTFTVHLTVEGLDGIPAHQSFPIKVNGSLERQFNAAPRRYVEGNSH